MKSDTNWQSVGLGLIAITILGLISWALFYEIGHAPWQFITILIALLGTLITVTANLQIQIRNEQKPKKVEIYEKTIKFYLEFIFAGKLGQEPKAQDEIIKNFYEMTPDLMLWASDDVLNSYINLRQLANNKIQDPSIDPNPVLGKMLLAMRKDLGHQNNQIDESSILRTFVNDI